MTAWTILEGDPAPGDVSAVSALASQFRRATEEFRDGQARIGRMMAGSSASSWQGPAAAAFAGGLEPLRDDLGSAANSFEVAAAALTTYGRALDDLQTRARGLLAQANQAQQRIDEANRSLARTSSQAEQTIASQGLDPLAAMIYRRQTLAPHQQAVRDAEGWLRSIRNQAHDLRREHEAAARRAADGFGQASSVGIRETFRDRALTVLTQVNIVTDAFAPAAALVAIGSLALAATILTGGTAAPLLAFAVGVGAKASIAVNLVDVGARVTRRGLDDETMSDSNARLGVDAALALLSASSLGARHLAAGRAKYARHVVGHIGYNGVSYQAVNTAHRSLNQAIILHRADTVTSVYELTFVNIPRSIELLTALAPHSVYAPPLPALPPRVATPSSIDVVSHAATLTSVDALQGSSISPTLQSSLTTPSLQGNDGLLGGLQPVSPTIRTTSYQRPIEVRE